MEGGREEGENEGDWRQCMRWDRLREGVMEVGKRGGGDRGRMMKREVWGWEGVRGGVEEKTVSGTRLPFTG